MTATSTSTYPFATSYHPGELVVQTRAKTSGVASELLAGKSKSLNFSKNHDAFLAAQSFAVVSSVDPTSGQVWVTPIFSRPRDITATSPTSIVIRNDAIPANDVLHKIISKQEATTPISMLGIDLNRRIRHRIMGHAAASSTCLPSTGDLHFTVNEYAPNCPKYINRREIIPSLQPVNPNAIRQERTTLTQDDQAFIQRADTLFLGTHAYHSSDVNHRGGRPGFVRMTSVNTIEWPEYRGNGMFFSSGNLEVQKEAGVTIIDFETGSVLQLSGTAVVDYNPQQDYEGATRVMKLHIASIAYTANATNHRWKLLQYSPYNPRVISDDDSDKENLLNGHDDDKASAALTLAKIVQESSPLVKTFRFVADRNIAFLPGQYATFEFPNMIPGGQRSETRTWTLSETPNSLKGDNTLDISVKRIPGGLVTNWLHDHAQVGMEGIRLLGVDGDMAAVQVNAKTQQPTVPKNLLLLSAGIGITPNLATVRGIGAFELQKNTSITMIHVERSEQDVLSHAELLRRSKNYPNFRYHTHITSKENGRRLDKQRLSELLVDIMDLSQQEVYICGPPSFMTKMTEDLVALGVPKDSIHVESFEF